MAKIKIDLPEKFQFKTEIPIRISDINYGGHLGNDALLSIVHEARLRYLNKFGLFEKEKNGTGIIMVDAGILYKSEGFYADVLIVEVAVADVTNTGYDFIYRITNKKSNKIVAIAKTGIVFYDYNKKKILQIPPKFKSIFN